jgi:hypothetical protein
VALQPEDYASPRRYRKLAPIRARSGVNRRLRSLLFRNEPRIRRCIAGLPRGLRLEVDLRLHSLVLLGLYEIELAPHIRALHRPGSSAFDVGAHDGYYALILARLGKKEVIAVEPDAAARADLERVLQANPQFAHLVHVVHQPAGERVTDETTTLDELATRPGGFVPDLLKIDVEGAEADVLRGATRLLTERRPHVIIETHSSALERDCLDILHRAGYEPKIVAQRNWLREDRPLLHNQWLVAEGAGHS